MTNKANTKRALLMSIIAMVLCFTMLLGTTFAWFTDEATSKGNKIVAGTSLCIRSSPERKSKSRVPALPSSVRILFGHPAMMFPLI